MPGGFQGILEGFEVGSGIALRQKALQMDQQRLGLEKTRQDTELARQQHLDPITALQGQREMIGASAAPHLAYLAQAPGETAEAYAARQQTDLYKNHAQQAQDITTQAQDLTKQLHNAYSDLAVPFWQGTHAQAQQDAAGITAGTVDPATLPPGRLAGLVNSGSGLPPELFRADSQTGRAPIQDAMDPFHQAIHTGDWSQTGPAMKVLFPEAQTAIGHQMAGGTVSGVELGPPTPGKDGALSVPQVYQVHMPDGSVRIVRPPALSTTQSDLAQRGAKVDQWARGTQHPEIQQGLQTAVATGQTPYGELTTALAGTGLPQSAYLPQTEYKEIPAFGSLAALTPGQPPRIVAEGQVKPMGGLEGLVQFEMSKHPDITVDQALANVQSTYQDRKAPPADGGAGLQALNDARHQRAADLAYRGAVQQLAREKGYEVDKDGNLKYGKADDAGKYSKGDAVDDQDFESQLSDLRQAADESAQAGRPLTASQLIGTARQHKPGGGAANDDSVAGPAKLANGQEIPSGTTVTDKHGNRMQYSGSGKWKRLPGAAPAAAPASSPSRSNAPSAPVAAAPPPASPADVRKLATPVNYGDYVKTGPSGAKRDIDKDLSDAQGSMDALQSSMSDTSLPESIRADMQRRFAAEIMRLHELQAVKQKLAS